MTTHFIQGKYREEDRVIGPSGEMHECQLAAVPGPLRGEFVMVTSLPWVSMGVGTTVELLVEVAPYWRPGWTTSMAGKV